MKYVKIDPDVPDLIRGTEDSAGIDLYNAGYSTSIAAGTSAIINTGIKVEIPKGYFGLATIRSSLGFKYGLGCHVGIIDSDFRGAMRVKITNPMGNENVNLMRHDRVAQLVLIPYLHIDPELVDELSDTVRGEGGYGSTGR